MVVRCRRTARCQYHSQEKCVCIFMYVYMYTFCWIAVSFQFILQTQSNWSLFNGTWQKGCRELDDWLSSEIGEKAQKFTSKCNRLFTFIEHMNTSVCVCITTRCPVARCLCVRCPTLCNTLQPSSTAQAGADYSERWGAGVETQKTVRGEIGGWGRVQFNEPYAPSLSTIYDGV